MCEEIIGDDHESFVGSYKSAGIFGTKPMETLERFQPGGTDPVAKKG